MNRFTIELDEMVCVWLNHISQITGEPIEKLISNGIGNLMIALEDDVLKNFLEFTE